MLTHTLCACLCERARGEGRFPLRSVHCSPGSSRLPAAGHWMPHGIGDGQVDIALRSQCGPQPQGREVGTRLPCWQSRSLLEVAGREEAGHQPVLPCCGGQGSTLGMLPGTSQAALSCLSRPCPWAPWHTMSSEVSGRMEVASRTQCGGCGRAMVTCGLEQPRLSVTASGPAQADPSIGFWLAS